LRYSRELDRTFFDSAERLIYPVQAAETKAREERLGIWSESMSAKAIAFRIDVTARSGQPRTAATGPIPTFDWLEGQGNHHI
jgi:hypothetical protein